MGQCLHSCRCNGATAPTRRGKTGPLLLTSENADFETHGVAHLRWENGDTLPHMQKSDVTCPECSAGYRRIELATQPGKQGEFRCLVCDHLLEVFDGSREIALRLTV
jgi:hypothetical protein